MTRGDMGSCQNMRKALRDGQKLGRKVTGQVIWESFLEEMHQQTKGNNTAKRVPGWVAKVYSIDVLNP